MLLVHLISNCLLLLCARTHTHGVEEKRSGPTGPARQHFYNGGGPFEIPRPLALARLCSKKREASTQQLREKQDALSVGDGANRSPARRVA
jgi:hypothetical protein